MKKLTWDRIKTAFLPYNWKRFVPRKSSIVIKARLVESRSDQKFVLYENAIVEPRFMTRMFHAPAWQFKMTNSKRFRIQNIIYTKCSTSGVNHSEYMSQLKFVLARTVIQQLFINFVTHGSVGVFFPSDHEFNFVERWSVCCVPYVSRRSVVQVLPFKTTEIGASDFSQTSASSDGSLQDVSTFYKSSSHAKLARIWLFCTSVWCVDGACRNRALMKRLNF